MNDKVIRALQREIAMNKKEITQREQRISKLESVISLYEGSPRVEQFTQTKSSTKKNGGNVAWKEDLTKYLTENPGQTQGQIVSGMFKGKHSQTRKKLSVRLHTILSMYKKQSILRSEGERGGSDGSTMKWFVMEKINGAAHKPLARKLVEA